MGDIGGIAQAGASIVSAGIQANAIGNAASSQEDAAKYAANTSLQAATNANALQQGEFNTQQKNIAPWLATGKSALSNIGAGLSSGAYDATYNGTFNAPTASGANPNFNAPTASGANPNFNANPNFSFDASSLTSDPGYQFQLNQGQQALTRAQAAQGVTGGAALKEIDRYNQDYAGTAYNTAYQRAQGTFQQNYQNQASQAQQNFANTESQFSNQFNRADTEAQQNFTNTENQFGNQFNRAQSEYGTQYNQFENDQNTNFNRQATLAGIGQTANAQLNSAGQNYANQSGANLVNAGAAAGQYATQGANAAAAGSIAQGNNLGSALSQLGRTFNVPAQLSNNQFAAAQYNLGSTGSVSPSQYASYNAGSSPAGYQDAYGNPSTGYAVTDPFGNALPGAPGY